MEDSLAMKSSGKHIFEWLLHVLTFSHGWGGMGCLDERTFLFEMTAAHLTSVLSSS
jgi:hypothetical protein